MIDIFINGLFRVISSKYNNPDTRIGEKVTLLSSGNEYTIFKQTGFGQKKTDPGVIFEIEFRFKPWIPKIFSPTIPFFLGMPGFWSKLWLKGNKSMEYAGQYVFRSEEDALQYGNSSAQKLIKSLCIKGNYKWNVTKINSYK